MTGEGIPDEFYIFVKRAHFLTRYNFEITKGFMSAAYLYAISDREFRELYKVGNVDYLPYVRNDNFKAPLSIYTSNIILNYRLEFDAEVSRMGIDPLYPSRLSAVYAFGDMASCEKAAKEKNWDISTVKKFKLSEMNDLVRIRKGNMGIISLLEKAYQYQLSQDTIDSIWQAYWSEAENITLELPDGELSTERKQFDSGLLWEYLIEGSLKVVD